MILNELKSCLDFKQIDSILDKMDYSKDIKDRTLFLYEIMEISQSFSCTCDNTEVTPEEEYSFAKQQLALINSRR